MATKKEKKQKPLEQVLMESCNKLRSNMSGINYMYFVMGLVFLKFASLKFEKRRNELANSEDAFAIDIPSFYAEKNVFYIPKNSRWTFIKNNSKKDKIEVEVVESGEIVKKEMTLGMLIDNALDELEKSNKDLKGALPIGMYNKASIPASNFSSLISEIDKICEDNEHPMNDLIGNTYQYMLMEFSKNTASEKGEFYTPANIVNLIDTLIEPYSGKLYDPACGTGGMFVQSYKFVENNNGNINNISVYGQESNPDTWKLARMNLGIRGIPAKLGKINADTFSNDQHKDVKFDYIMANPPFNLPDWRTENQLVDDPRWAGYGLPPVSNANYAWILHMLSKLSVNGIAGFLLANGALGDSERSNLEIRKNLIKKGKIECIIILPREMFFYPDISVTLWIMDNNPCEKIVKSMHGEKKVRDRTNDILLMDLRTYGKKTNLGNVELSEETVKMVKEIYENWKSPNWKNLYKNIPELCQSVTIDEIRNGMTDKKRSEKGISINISDIGSTWSLIPSKYIEFIDHDLEIDFPKEMTRIQKEMSKLLKEEKASQKQLEDAFRGIGYDIE